MNKLNIFKRRKSAPTLRVGCIVRFVGSLNEQGTDYLKEIDDKLYRVTEVRSCEDTACTLDDQLICKYKMRYLVDVGKNGKKDMFSITCFTKFKVVG